MIRFQSSLKLTVKTFNEAVGNGMVRCGAYTFGT